MYLLFLFFIVFWGGREREREREDDFFLPRGMCSDLLGKARKNSQVSGYLIKTSWVSRSKAFVLISSGHTFCYDVRYNFISKCSFTLKFAGRNLRFSTKRGLVG